MHHQGEPVTKSRRQLQTMKKEASFETSDSDSSEPTPVQTDADRQRDQDQDLLEKSDHAEMWRIHTEDLC